MKSRRHDLTGDAAALNERLARRSARLNDLEAERLEREIGRSTVSAEQLDLDMPEATVAVNFCDPDGTDHDGAKGTRWSWLIRAVGHETWVRRQLARWHAEGRTRITAELLLPGRTVVLP